MMSVPSILIEPRSGRSRPISDLRNTDLPVPEGPSRTLTSPAGMVIVTFSQIRDEPKDLVSPSTSIATPTRHPSACARGHLRYLCGTRHCNSPWAAASRLCAAADFCLSQHTTTTTACRCQEPPGWRASRGSLNVDYLRVTVAPAASSLVFASSAT